MKELNEKIARCLKPLQAEVEGYEFKYSYSFDSVIIEIVEQTYFCANFVPISTKFSCQKVKVYVRVLQTTEIAFDRLKEIFSKIEKALKCGIN